jgi:acetyl esterase/lipase
MRLRLLLATTFFLLLTHCATESEPTYLEKRAAFETNLLTKGPLDTGRKGPSRYGEDWELPMDRIQKITYPSAGLELKAWVYVPEEAQQTPALVYFHSGRLFSEVDMRNCKPFIDRGFVVMTPMVRGESENPGFFEMFLGEVDDAKAAIVWLAQQPYVDRDRIYALGFSFGGGIASVLSLLDGVPVRHSASIGGLYDLYEPGIHEYFAGFAPFDTSNDEEWKMRMLLGNIRWMKHEHYAYIGADDVGLPASIPLAQKEMEGTHSLLRIITVPGSHVTSFRAAMESYLDLVLDDIEGTT